MMAIDIKGSVKQTLEAIGYYHSRLESDPFAGVAVLTYHAVRADDWPAGTMRFEELHVTVARLDDHCRVLRDLGCTVVSLAEWGAIARGECPPPLRAVMVTFDDGYRSVLQHGLPVLERWSIPATVFVCTSPIDRQVRFWFDALAEREGEDTVASVKAGEHDGWIRAAACEMPVDAGDPHAPLTIDELRHLSQHPLITIGAHTVSHPMLLRAPVLVQADEIGKARTTLEAWLGAPAASFAYPGGQPGVDYDAQTVDLVSRSGFEFAFTTVERFGRPSDGLFEYPRFTMLQGISGAELAHRLAVSWPRQGGVN